MAEIPRKPTTHTCPGGCGQQVGNKSFACRSCWFRLPAPLRRAIREHHATGRVQAHADAAADGHRWFQANPRTCPCKPSPDGRRWRSAACRIHGVPAEEDDPAVDDHAELLPGGRTEVDRLIADATARKEGHR